MDLLTFDSQYRYVEGAASEVVDQYSLVQPALCCSEGNGRGRGLVEYIQDFETGNLARRNGGPAADIVEIGRDGNDGLGDGPAQGRFGIILELFEDDRRTIDGRETPGFLFVGSGGVGHMAI